MFNSEKLYLPSDPALLVIGKPSTLAHWRCQGEGPSFIKLGDGPKGRVAYSGADLNKWLQDRKVQHPEPEARPAA